MLSSCSAHMVRIQPTAALSPVPNEFLSWFPSMKSVLYTVFWGCLYLCSELMLIFSASLQFCYVSSQHALTLDKSELPIPFPFLCYHCWEAAIWMQLQNKHNRMTSKYELVYLAYSLVCSIKIHTNQLVSMVSQYILSSDCSRQFFSWAVIFSSKCTQPLIFVQIM